MAFNVLLMLATSEDPDPKKEVAYHAGQCHAGRTTYVLTPKVLNASRSPQMTSDRSVVAFYGDKPLANALLAHGIFVSYIGFNSPQGQQLFQHHGLYNVNNIPGEPKGFIEVRNLIAEPPGTTIDALNGIIESRGGSHGLVLTLDNLPKSPARGQVYYRCRT